MPGIGANYNRSNKTGIANLTLSPVVTLDSNDNVPTSTVLRFTGGFTIPLPPELVKHLNTNKAAWSIGGGNVPRNVKA